MPKKYWMGNEKNCDICEAPFKNAEWFADSRCTFTNSNFEKVHKWALVCPMCHFLHTDGKFGVGIGQKYDSRTKLKLEG